MRFRHAIRLLALLSCAALLGGPVLANTHSGGGGLHTPMPTPKPTPTPKPALIPVPSALRDTRDPQVCGTHAGPIGAIACGVAYTGGSLVLVFNWAGDKAYPSVGGFNVYEVDNGLHKLVDQNTTQATIAIVKRSGGGFGNRCYTVTAVVGKRESKDSRWRCLAAGSVGPFTTEVTANAWTQRARLQDTGLSGYGPKCSTAAPCVGYVDDYYYDASRGALQLSAYYRAYFHFKLDPDLKHLYVMKATLSDSASGYIGTNCLYELGPATSNWMGESAGSTVLVGGEFHQTNGASLSAGIDVTPIVHAWADGSMPNNGFVLRGKLETLKLPDSLTKRPPSLVATGCVEALDKSAKLGIVHS